MSAKVEDNHHINFELFFLLKDLLVHGFVADEHIPTVIFVLLLWVDFVAALVDAFDVYHNSTCDDSRMILKRCWMLELSLSFLTGFHWLFAEINSKIEKLTIELILSLAKERAADENPLTLVSGGCKFDCKRWSSWLL